MPMLIIIKLLGRLKIDWDKKHREAWILEDSFVIKKKSNVFVAIHSSKYLEK